MQIKRLKLNFLPDYVMFYDWIESDDIKDYDDISVFRVNSKTIEDFISYNIKIIENSLSIYHRPIILSDTYTALAVIIDYNGQVTHKSSLILKDELSINKDIIDLRLKKICYEKIDLVCENNELRRVEYIKKVINDELVKIANDKDYAKLDYFYYELFNKKDNNYSLMLEKIQKQINNELGERELYLYNLIRRCYKLV